VKSGLRHRGGRHGLNTSPVVVARLDRATQYAATSMNMTASPLVTDPGYWIARLNRAMTLKI
jgi:hypothetical protein